MKFSITKQFRFEGAHRLIAPYQGKCSNLHGHSWEVSVTITGNTLDARDFLLDFAELHPIKTWIESKLDHATLVSNSDSALLDWLQRNKQKHFVIHGNPTSEKLAQNIYDECLALGFTPTLVTVRETSTCTVSYGSKESS